MVNPIKNTKPPEVEKAVEKPVAPIVRYLNKNIKISPRKLRLLARTIKKVTPQVALTQLKFTNSKSARVLLKAVQTVISTAKSNYSLAPETLTFDSIRVDEGLKIKRMDKSHGSRFSRGLIQKRHSRLEIKVKVKTN
ncbi:MAG: uL22 family ribosomal protein [Candidatus Shapirobacteria bacterium]|jgi:large subunit ribosomal protein L22